MDEGQVGRRYKGHEALARMYPPTRTWREGYYEGATDDGGRVLFLVPSKTNVIARFQVVLNVLTTSATEEDEAGTYRFEAKDLKMIFDGAFRHMSCEGLLFALHGALAPDGEAHGRCIGVVNGAAGHGPWGTDFHFGSSQWTRWEAAWKTTEDDPTLHCSSHGLGGIPNQYPPEERPVLLAVDQQTRATPPARHAGPGLPHS